MQTLSDNNVPRKRLTTYGKTSRKRVPEPVDLSRFAAHSEDDEDEKQVRNNKKSKFTHTYQSVPTTSSRGRSPATSRDVDMFDVPSSDDEEKRSPKKGRKIVSTAINSGKGAVISHLSDDIAQRLPSPPKKPPPTIRSTLAVKKSLKISSQMPVSAEQVAEPVRTSDYNKMDVDTSFKDLKNRHGRAKAANMQAAKIAPTKESEALGKQIRHDRPTSLDSCVITAGQSSRADVEVVNFLNKPSPQPSPGVLTQPQSIPSTPSVHEDRSPNITRSVTPTVLTPKGQRMWDGLLGDELAGKTEIGTANSISSRKRTRENTSADLQEPMPRRRLIDSLINQSRKQSPTLDSSSDSSLGEDDFTDVGVTDSPSIFFPRTSSMSATIGSTRVTENIEKVALPVATGTGNQNTQIAGPRITYSRQRSMLAEHELSEKMAFNTPLDGGFPLERRQNRRGSIPVLGPLHSLQETNEVDEGQASAAIRTIHELRQAGAQSRFLDEVDDLLDRIGTPTQQTSMRRSALIDLAKKMKEKDFQTKFVNNGLDQRLFLHLGQEEDVICGFAMVSLLMMVLDSGMTSVDVSQLRRQGITRLFIRLLDFGQSILMISKDRKTNMSKSAQIMLSEQHEMSLNLGVWGERKPDVISPRTAALRCLEMIVRQCRDAGNTADLISKELTNKLFGVLKLYLGDTGLLAGSSAVDFQLALSTLESHSLRATTILNEHLPVVRDVLEIILRSPADDPDLPLTLRLALNVTNSDATTTNIFVTPDIVHGIGNAIVSKFALLSKFLVEDERVAVVDNVILMLGVMMNFAQWSGSACQALGTQGGTNFKPLDDMVLIFSDNLEKISEADSVEDSQRNVAFGYLAVVLGYFALVPELLTRIRIRLKSLHPLINSIEEFITLHQKVDELYKDQIDDFNPHTDLTERFKRMVGGLKSLPM